MAFKGKIQSRLGKWTDTCVTSSNLTENQLKKPILRDFLEYADKRMISTLLVSGAGANPYALGYIPTKLGKIDESKKVGSNAYQFDIMGRIQRPVQINGQIGATQADGTFTLSLVDRGIWPGMNCNFYGAGFQARCMSGPTGGPGNYIYEFKSPDGTLFVAATHMNGQGATKTLFGGHTSYGEKSLRGYGTSHFPDSFVQHMTIQRKAISITGDAATDVIWYEYANDSGAGDVGWRFEAERQAKATFNMENEYQKWDGISTMKNDDGTLRVKSRIQDSETGMDVIAGDGITQQLAGGNESFGSGVNGFWNNDDLRDMLATIRKKGNMLDGNVLVGVTGEDGMANAQDIFPILSGNQNVQMVQLVDQSPKAGGAKVDVGFKFQVFNVDGDQIVLVKHPMFDDSDRYPYRTADGKLAKSADLYLMTMEIEGRKNVDILSKGAYGIDRSFIEKYLNGLTGIDLGSVVSAEDALDYECLKHDMIIVYNTAVCGMVHKNG